MPTSEKFSAWIEIGNEPVEEYQEKVVIQDGDKYVQCWIASETEKCFQICIHHEERIFDVGYSITIDGKELPCGGMIKYHPDLSKAAPYPSARVKGISLGGGWLQPFMFSDCMLVDPEEEKEESVNMSFDNNDSIGEICIVIWRVFWRQEKLRAGHGRNTPELMHMIPAPTAPLRLNERAFKMAEHCSRLGPPQRTKKPITGYALNETEKIFMEKKRVNLVSFVFRYRSLGRLRADGVAPTPRLIYPGIIDLTGDSESEQDRARSVTLEGLRQEIRVLKVEASELKRRLLE